MPEELKRQIEDLSVKHDKTFDKIDSHISDLASNVNKLAITIEGLTEIQKGQNTLMVAQLKASNRRIDDSNTMIDKLFNRVRALEQRIYIGYGAVAVVVAVLPAAWWLFNEIHHT